MKKVLEKLERVEGCIMLAHAEASSIDREELNRAIDYLNEAMAELKTPRNKPPGDERRIQCNWCESVFDEKHIKVVDDTEYCPVCGDSEYLMDIPNMDTPRWYTPERWEAETGKPYPPSRPVWSRYRTRSDWSPWITLSLASLRNDQVNRSLNKVKTKYQTVCNYMVPGPPPDNWKPE
jgi:hypothetical protein